MRFIIPRMLQILKAEEYIVVRDAVHRRHQDEGATPQPMVLNLLALMNDARRRPRRR